MQRHSSRSSTDSSNRSGQTVVQQQTPIEASAYTQSLDAGLEPPELTTSTVRYWSDFNRVFLHPRSVVQLNEYELNSSLQPFDKWASGEDLFASLDKEHDVLDRDLRPFIEEADQMQGIQLMASIDDAWGGFATRYLERIRDEYGKTPVWIWGLQDSFDGLPREKRVLRLANKARTMTEAYKQASLLIPMALPSRKSLMPSVSLDPSSPWHTSALLATAIESVTLPTRLRHEPRDTLGTITDLLNVMGKQTVASLSMSVSAPKDPEAQPADQRIPLGDDHDLQDESLHLQMDFSPSEDPQPGRRLANGHKQPHIFGQTVVTRGRSGEPSSAMEDDLQRARAVQRRHAQQTFARRYRTTLSYPQPDSFPRIFADDAGALLSKGSSVDVTAALTTDSSVSARMKLLRTNVVRSIGIEDRETLGNELAEMADEYHEGWSSDSDTGDDD